MTTTLYSKLKLVLTYFNFKNKLKFHILLNFIFKILSLFFNYLIISSSLHYLDNEKYGIWVTFLSIISWITYMDVGISNSLRNSISENITKNNKQEIKEFISTAYFLIGLSSIILIIVFATIIPIINWNSIFNSQIISSNELSYTVAIYSILFVLYFLFSLINQIYYAYNLSYFVSLIQLISSFLIYIFIILISSITKGNLILVSIIYGAVNLIIILIFNLFFFIREPNLIPIFKYFNFNKIKSLFSVGSKFFIIQIAVIIIFTSGNLVITQVLGPEYVTQYNIGLKLFTLFTFCFNIVMAPLWNVFTTLFFQNNIKSIYNLFNKLYFLFILFVISIVFFIMVYPYVLKIWLGNTIKLELDFVILFAIHTIISIWSNIFATFLNSISCLNISVILTIFISFINIPLSIMFIKYFNMGISGVVLSGIICLSFGAIISPLQTYYLLKNNHQIDYISRFFK